MKCSLPVRLHVVGTKLDPERVYCMQEYSLIERHGVCIRVLGDLALLPASVQAAADRVMEATQHHTRGRLNICLSYG